MVDPSATIVLIPLSAASLSVKATFLNLGSSSVLKASSLFSSMLRKWVLMSDTRRSASGLLPRYVVIAFCKHFEIRMIFEDDVVFSLEISVVTASNGARISTASCSTVLLSVEMISSVLFKRQSVILIASCWSKYLSSM